MKAIGIIVAIVGALVAFVALFMSTTALGSEVYNLGLLQNQMMVFAAGLAAIVAGAAITAAGAVIEAIGQTGRVPATDETIALVPSAAPVRPVQPALTPEKIRERNARADRVMYIYVGGLVAVMTVFMTILWAVS